MSESQKEYQSSKDPFVNSWQEKTARQAKKDKKVMQGLLATGAASVAVASGIGYAEGQVKETAMVDTGLAGAALLASRLPNAKYEEQMDVVRKAGEPSNPGEMLSDAHLKEFTHEHGIVLNQKQ